MLLHQCIGRAADFPARRFEASLACPSDTFGHRLIQPCVVFEHGNHRPKRVVISEIQSTGHPAHTSQAGLVRNVARYLAK